jgi:hypothetical protein
MVTIQAAAVVIVMHYQSGRIRWVLAIERLKALGHTFEQAEQMVMR